MVKEVFLDGAGALVTRQGMFMKKLEEREVAAISFGPIGEKKPSENTLIVRNAERTVRKGVVFANRENILYKMSAGQFTPFLFRECSPFCKFYGSIPNYYDFWVPEMYIHMMFDDDYLWDITYIFKKEKPIFLSNLYPNAYNRLESETLRKLGINENNYFFARLCIGNTIPSELRAYKSALQNVELLTALSINARGNGDLNPNRKAEILNEIFISLRKELPLSIQDSFHLIYMFLTEASESISNQAELDDFYHRLNRAMDLFSNEKTTDPFLELVKKNGYTWNFINDRRKGKQ